MVLDTGAFEATVLAAVVLAGAARIVIPYLAKRQGDISAGVDPRPFSISYIITGILGIVPVAIGSILLLPTILPQVQNNGSQLMVFITAFGLAYATTDIVNRNVSTLLVQTPLTTTTATKTNFKVASDVGAQPQQVQPKETTQNPQ
jgi:hypothetical protein